MNINIFDYLKETANVSLTPQQLQAAQTIEGPVLLLAVPGAGKTTVMVARIANMIFHHQIDPGAILTITFSKAGAVDMRRRYEALFSSLSEKYHREIPSFSTIHAFCYRVLGSYCKLTGGTAPSLIESRDRTLILRELYGQIAGEFLTEDLEEELELSKSYINASFKKYTGRAPIDFFINLKMQEACKLLKSTDLYIVEISQKLGYDDPYYFSRIFKKVMGVSPKEYRNGDYIQKQ